MDNRMDLDRGRFGRPGSRGFAAGTVVPPGSLVAGVPAKVRRELTDEERAGIRENAARYLEYAEAHRGAAKNGTSPAA